MLTSYSVAGTTPQSNYIFNSGQSGSFTDSDFWLYGSGVGTLTVSVPYSLQINLSETAPRLPEQGPYDATAATAVARLVMGPGVLEGGYQAETLSWSESDPALNGVLTRSGVLSVTKGFNNPYWGPLTSVFVDVPTSATERVVPEPSSFLLLVLGLVVLTVRWWKWRGSALV
jgi:hypothetical protein